MKKIFYLIFILSFISCNHQKKELTVNLETHEGYGVFRPGKVIIWPSSDSFDYKNVPTDIDEYVVRNLVLQKDHYFLNKYLSGQISKEKFVKISEHLNIDTTKLTGENVDCEILFLIGTWNNKRIIIVDSDNDEDFGDEIILKYNYPINRKKQKEITDNLPVIETQYDYYENNEIISKTLRIKPSPYKGSLSLKFYTNNEIEKKYYLFASIPEYKKGEIFLNKVNCDIYVTNSFTQNTYKKDRTKLFISPKKETKPSEIDGDIPYEIGDVFNIKGHDYLIDSITKWGNKLFIQYLGENKYPVGVTEDLYMPKFEAKHLDNSVFTFKQHPDKYILFDFWGTWCNPCIKLIPDLKKLHSDFKDKNFVLVSVAFDKNKQTVIDFIEQNEMNWDHLFVSQKRSDENSLINKLKISRFPSTILVAPDGKIIARNKDIEELRKILNKRLNAL